MNNGVDERLPYRNKRNRPAVLAAQALNDRFLCQVLSRETGSFLYRKNLSLRNRSNHPDCGHLPPLVLGGHPERTPRFGREFPVRRKELGSNSEVNGFRLQFWKRRAPQTSEFSAPFSKPQ